MYFPSEGKKYPGLYDTGYNLTYWLQLIDQMFQYCKYDSNSGRQKKEMVCTIQIKAGHGYGDVLCCFR